MPEWMPIESAPKDGTRVLVFGLTAVGMGVRSARFDTEYSWWACHTSQLHPMAAIVEEPTHWMPLPSPPESV